MSGKKTKLKKMKLTSVDMVRRGANQEAFINLYKSEGDPVEHSAPPDTSESVNTGDIPQSLWKSIVDAVKAFMDKGEDHTDEEGEKNPEEVEKAAETFQTRVSQQEIRDNRWKYQDALNMSIESIISDNDLSDEEKIDMMNQSVDQFSAAYKEMCAKLVNAKPNKVTDLTATAVGKSQEEIPDETEITEEGEEEMKIDKSRFSPEELEQYQALIAKGRVEDEEPEIDEEETEEEEEMQKSAELHPEVKKALAEMADLKKSYEMKEMKDIAKKYAPLGKKEDELAATLYEMKKSSQASYDAYIAVLDQNLDLVNKSGMFSEIGKSGRGYAGNTTVEKVEGIAKGYMEKDPNMDYNTAVMKAWENHPELMDAYDAEY